jgi:RHS repeat-associated protein
VQVLSSRNPTTTGKERDAESGLDYFGARYYSSGQGRFLSPDEFTGGPVIAFSPSDPLPPGPLPYAEITNPQSLSKYAYAWNNPIVYFDPDGHDVIVDSSLQGMVQKVAQESPTFASELKIWSQSEDSHIIIKPPN